MTDQAPTTPDTVVVPLEPTEAMMNAWHEAVAKGIFGENGDGGKPHPEYMRDAYRAMLAARPAPAPGGEREDSAFKIASDLHAAYEQLIYGLPKYLEAENLTDEENMIREAYITLDVTAHRLAALSRPAPVAGEASDTRIGPWRIWFDSSGGRPPSCDWNYQHEDDEGSCGWMSGMCASRDDCLEEIITHYEERG